jgi:hypothetical protein
MPSLVCRLSIVPFLAISAVGKPYAPARYMHSHASYALTLAHVGPSFTSDAASLTLAHAHPFFKSERGLSSQMLLIRPPSAPHHIAANTLENVIALMIFVYV